MNREVTFGVRRKSIARCIYPAFLFWHFSILEISTGSSKGVERNTTLMISRKNDNLRFFWPCFIFSEIEVCCQFVIFNEFSMQNCLFTSGGFVTNYLEGCYLTFYFPDFINYVLLLR